MLTFFKDTPTTTVYFMDSDEEEEMARRRVRRAEGRDKGRQQKRWYSVPFAFFSHDHDVGWRACSHRALGNSPAFFIDL